MEYNHTINSFVYWVMARFHFRHHIPFQPGSDWKIYYPPATWPSYNDLHSASCVMTHPFVMDTFVYKYEISISLLLFNSMYNSYIVINISYTRKGCTMYTGDKWRNHVQSVYNWWYIFETKYIIVIWNDMDKFSGRIS